MNEDLEKQMEEAVANLYVVLYRMREAKEYQQEYDEMGSLINMLSQDRDFLRRKYNVEI